MLFIKQEEYKNKKGIYEIVNIDNGMSYVGQTKESFIRRFWHHTHKLNRGTHDNANLQKDWNCFGGGVFEFRVICVCEGVSDLDAMEMRSIQERMSLGKSYNISLGGLGRRCPMSDNAKRIVGDKNRLHMTGRKLSQETKNKMSASRLGKVPNRKSNTITPDIARMIKHDLIHNVPYSQIYDKYGITYRVINNMISNNAWKSVYVNGWDDFLMNKRSKRRTYDNPVPSHENGRCND